MAQFVKDRQNEQRMQAFRERAKENREMELMKIENRAENRRCLRKLHVERQEAEMEDRIMKAKEAEAMRRCQLEQEERLTQQMDLRKRKEWRELKMRQRLRESSIELRDLESKLQAAYLKKEILAQCAEKKAAMAWEKELEKQIHVLHIVGQEGEKEKALKKKCEYRKDLQDQIIFAQKSKERAYYEFLQEKRLVDQITAKILEEDCKLEEEKMLKKAKAKEEIAAYMQKREEEIKKRKAAHSEEDRKLMEFLRERALRDDEMRRIKEEKEAQKDELRHKLGTILYETEMEKLERAEMLVELHISQTLNADEEKRRAELEKEIRERLELRETSVRQVEDKLKRRLEQQEQEQRWRQELLEQFAEDERLAQLTTQKRWEKQQEHRRAIQKILEERRAAYAEEMQLRIKEEEVEAKLHEARLKLVEEERLRMLREHAVGLIGYLPPGIIRPEDVPHLGSEVAEMCGYKKEDLEDKSKCVD